MPFVVDQQASDTKQESQNGDKEFENSGRRGRRRPAEACFEHRFTYSKAFFFAIPSFTFCPDVIYSTF